MLVKLLSICPGCMSENLRGRDGALNGRGPQPSGWGRFQTYILIIPGSVVPANLGALEGSQGRRHITRRNKILGGSGRFARPLRERSRKSAGSPGSIMYCSVLPRTGPQICATAPGAVAQICRTRASPRDQLCIVLCCHGRVRQICATAPGAVAQICRTRPSPRDHLCTYCFVLRRLPRDQLCIVLCCDGSTGINHVRPISLLRVRVFGI